METIPYYDFSVFPLSSKISLEKINLAVNEKFKVIFIDFGGFFPWSIDNIIKSDFAYSDKLIDKIVNICRENDIILIPVLSILLNSDFVLNDYKYKYLTKGSIKQVGLDSNECGMAKLVEQMIDDIYSLFSFSDFFLIELPDHFPEDSFKDRDDFNIHFLKRISKYLSDSGKNLILGCRQNCKKMNFQYISAKIDFIMKYYIKIINISNNNSYHLDLILSEIELKDTKYQVSYLCGTDGFTGGLDVGNILSNYNEVDLANVKHFFTLLDDLWSHIRNSWEELSLVYSNEDTVYRIKFCRSVKYLNQINVKFLTICNIISDAFDSDYQPGVIKIWLNAKRNTVSSQLNKLNDIVHSMGGDL